MSRFIRNSADAKIKWDLCNKILNFIRDVKGLPLRPSSDNPFISVENKKRLKLIEEKSNK